MTSHYRDTGITNIMFLKAQISDLSVNMAEVIIYFRVFVQSYPFHLTKADINITKTNEQTN